MAVDDGTVVLDTFVVNVTRGDPLPGMTALLNATLRNAMGLTFVNGIGTITQQGIEALKKLNKELWIAPGYVIDIKNHQLKEIRVLSDQWRKLNGAIIVYIAFDYDVSDFGTNANPHVETVINTYVYDDLNNSLWFYDNTNIPGNHWARINLNFTETTLSNGTTYTLAEPWNTSGSLTLAPVLSGVSGGAYPRSPAQYYGTLYLESN